MKLKLEAQKDILRQFWNLNYMKADITWSSTELSGLLEMYGIKSIPYKTKQNQPIFDPPLCINVTFELITYS